MSADETYIFEQLTADEQLIHEQQMARLAELLPGWSDDDNKIESLVSRAFAEQEAVLVDLASDLLATIVAEVARTAGIQQGLSRPAVGTATLTTDGAEAYVLPAGATVVAHLPDQTAVSFETIADVAIPSGTTTVPAVPVQAVDDGLLATIATPQAMEPDQAYAWLLGVTLDALSDLGADGEDDDAYLGRGSRRLALLADQLILPRDVEAFVRDIDGVGRVLVIDQMDATTPSSPASPVERCLTVVPTGPDGAPPTGPLLSVVDQQIQARREVSFKFFVVPPTYVPVDVELTVAAWPEYMATAGPDTEAEILRWLHPSTFGATSLEQTTEAPDWARTSTVRVGEVVSVADRVVGVDYVPPSLVKIGGINADFTLVAPIAALPDPANTTVTVHVVARQP